MREPVFDLLTGHLAKMIQRRMAAVCPVTPAPGLPPNAMARMFAAALVEMLRWWLMHRADANAREMDARFHSIVWAGLARTAQRP